MTGVIYCYTNLINNKKYIGQTINLDGRMKNHKSNAFNIKSREYNTPFHRAIRKYGIDNFSFEILAEAESFDELNELEIWFIAQYDTQVPNGYNIEAGGNNASHALTDEAKEKLRWSHGKLTLEEVQDLRKAYLENQSPTKIYKEKYQNRMHYNSFLNIWCGKRYETVMPEVFNQRAKHTKLTEKIVYQIKKDRAAGMSLQKIANKYNISKSTVADIAKGRTWKNVQI